MRNKFRRFLSEYFDVCRILVKRARKRIAGLGKKFRQMDRMNMLYILIAADLLILAVLITVLLSRRPNGEQSVEAPPEMSPAAAVATTEPTPAPAVTATPTPSPTPEPSPTPKPRPAPSPAPALTPAPATKPPPITPPASGSQDPASPSNIVLVTARPVSDTDIPNAAAR